MVGVVRTRAGVTLVEVLVALAILGVAGGALLTMTGGGLRGARVAEEWELATVLGSRLVDRLLAEGYRQLEPRTGQAGPLDLATLEEPADEPTTTPRDLVAGGATYRATYAVARRAPGLLDLEVTVT